MHTVLFEHWWRDESARVRQPAEMVAMAREAEGADAGRRSSRRRHLVRPVGPGSGRLPAGAVAFVHRVAGYLSMPVTAATVAGKRG